MIDFTDVRRTKKETHYFFNASRQPALEFFLKSAGVTDYKILRHEEMRTVVGKDDIPNVPIDMIGGPSMRATALLISHFNVKSLQKKIDKLMFSKEYHEWDMARSEAELKHVEKYYGDIFYK